MSKKNSNVILKNSFKDFDDLSKSYLNFKDKLDTFKKKSYVVAVSGGPDSLALVALSKAYNFEKKTKFFYVLVNHNIRKNSTTEAKKVKNLLKKNKLNLIILTNKTKIMNNVQSNARKIRYKILSNFCRKKKITNLITAHNLEDQVETFLIRLSRGSGLKGLSSMKIRTHLDNKIWLYRPLLEIKKEILKKISKKIFGNYIRDPSNKNEKYLRTKIRALKKPLLKSGINYDQIIKSINNLASSQIVLDKYFKKITKGKIKKTKNKVLINFNSFKNYEEEIQMRVINNSIKFLKGNYYNSRSRKVINLIKSISSKSFFKATLGGCIFYKQKDQILLKKEQK